MNNNVYNYSVKANIGRGNLLPKVWLTRQSVFSWRSVSQNLSFETTDFHEQVGKKEHNVNHFPGVHEAGFNLSFILTAYLLPHHGKLSYGRRPRQLRQLRNAAGVKRSRGDRHQGRRVGRQKLPSPERGQNDNDRGKTREFKQRDGKASYLPRRRRARRNLKSESQIPWCANYVCSDNSSNVFFLRTKRSWTLEIPWNLMQFWGNMTHSSCLYLCLGAKLNFRYKLLLHFPFPTRVQEQLALWPYSIHPESSKWHSKTTRDKIRILFIPHTEEKTLNKDNITYGTSHLENNYKANLARR